MSANDERRGELTSRGSSILDHLTSHPDYSQTRSFARKQVRERERADPNRPRALKRLRVLRPRLEQDLEGQYGLGILDIDGGGLEEGEGGVELGVDEVGEGNDEGLDREAERGESQLARVEGREVGSGGDKPAGK